MSLARVRVFFVCSCACVCCSLVCVCIVCLCMLLVCVFACACASCLCLCFFCVCCFLCAFAFLYSCFACLCLLLVWLAPPCPSVVALFSISKSVLFPPCSRRFVRSELKLISVLGIVDAVFFGLCCVFWTFYSGVWGAPRFSFFLFFSRVSTHMFSVSHALTEPFFPFLFGACIASCVAAQALAAGSCSPCCSVFQWGTFSPSSSSCAPLLQPTAGAERSNPPRGITPHWFPMIVHTAPSLSTNHSLFLLMISSFASEHTDRQHQARSTEKQLQESRSVPFLISCILLLSFFDSSCCVPVFLSTRGGGKHESLLLDFFLFFCRVFRVPFFSSSLSLTCFLLVMLCLSQSFHDQFFLPFLGTGRTQ